MARFDLFLISGLILFLELACIRWLPAHVLYLSFFTNTVLLASFVGMSVGCLIARKPGRELDRTPYWLTALIITGLLVAAFRGKLERHTNVGDQAQPEVVFFGAEVSAVRPVEFTVPVELVAGIFFLLTAATLVGPGQELGRAFNRVPSRTTAYALDLLGSLAGIALFASCSALQLPPVVWFGVAGAGLAYFVTKSPRPEDSDGPLPERKSPTFAVMLLAISALATVATSGLVKLDEKHNHTFWSPYYRIDYVPAWGSITTNQISHQVMIPRGNPAHAQYDLPYLFQQATGRPMFRRVLIIGSGSGNDLARCLYWCPDVKIDAVDIEPVIQRIGSANHPDHPYQDPRVTFHLNDGRNFLRKAPDGEYDLVIFALVDSLVLHSGYSNIRLESYLFTQQSFNDVARVLKPDGEAVVYNYFRQPWIVARIRDEMRTAFGGKADPLVFVDPPVPDDRLPTDDTLVRSGGFTAIFAGREAGIGPLREKFAANGNTYWVPGRAATRHDQTGGFGASAPAVAPPADGGTAEDAQWLRGRPDWVQVRPVTVEEASDLTPATDDWPFLYVRRPTVPGLTWRGVALTVVLSALLWWMFRERPASGGVQPRRSYGDAGLLARSFLLGAGFMLIETKAVVQMALLFGSTWTVNTFVFAAVLVMALAGNLYAGWAKPRHLGPYYMGLFLALGANLLIPPDSFLGMDRTVQTALACGLAFAPILFAGVIFPVSFARAPRPDRFFGANVAGALAGGLTENLSMLLGFQLLLIVAVGLYGLSGLLGGKSLCTSPPERGV